MIVSDMGADQPAIQEMGLPPGVNVSVATFNVALLFDTICDSRQCNPGDFEQAPSEGIVTSKIERLQRAVQTLDADVIVFQEIEKESLLERVAEPVRTSYPTLVFGETGFAGSVDVGLVSRGELLEVIKHGDKPIMTPSGGTDRFARELLEVHLQIRGVRVVVFVGHFVSKRTPGLDERRWAEANATGIYAAQAGQRHPEALVVVAGDLNDVPGSSPLNALKSHGLIVPGESLDPATYYTHSFRGDGQILDHILYLNNGRATLPADGVVVFRDEGRDGFGGSDHGTPRATFRVKE